MQGRKHTFVVIGAVGLIGLTAFATLLGVKPGLPLMFFDNQGTTSYDTGTGEFSVDGMPVAIRFVSTDPPRFVQPTGDDPTKFIDIDILVGRDVLFGDPNVLVRHCDGRSPRSGTV